MKKSVVLSLLLMLLCSGIASASLTDGLVAYYPFNGNANDASGNGNNGIPHGGITFAEGVLGQAASFDGLDDYIEVANGSAFDFAPNPFSVSLWISRSGDHTRDWITIVRHNIPAESGHGWLIYTFPDEIFRVSPLSVQDSSAMPINEWIHYVYVFTGVEPRLYKDGQLIYTGEHKTAYNSADPKLWIGGYTGSNQQLTGFFSGMIDELRIYNRALSESEIQELYTGSTCSQDDYNAAFEAGRQACIKDPASCGINTNGANWCGSIVYSGLLPTIHYPCLNIDGTNYSVDFGIYSSDPLLFNVTGMGLTQ